VYHLGSVPYISLLEVQQSFELLVFEVQRIFAMLLASTFLYYFFGLLFFTSLLKSKI
jgi:hypothetical protein